MVSLSPWVFYEITVAAHPSYVKKRMNVHSFFYRDSGEIPNWEKGKQRKEQAGAGKNEKRIQGAGDSSEGLKESHSNSPIVSPRLAALIPVFVIPVKTGIQCF